MRFSRLLLGSALVLTLSLPSFAKTNKSNKAKSHHSALHKLHLRRHSGPSGQKAIDDQRATQFQAALVKSGYLTSSQATGHWDAATQSAMQKFQADNGWQTRLVPDSRAIIKLGLGPAQDSSASTTVSTPTIATTASTGASFLQK